MTVLMHSLAKIFFICTSLRVIRKILAERYYLQYNEVSYSIYFWWKCRGRSQSDDLLIKYFRD